AIEFFNRKIITAPAFPTDGFALGKIPGNGLRIRRLPIVLKLIASTIGADPRGPGDAQCPAANIHFMRSVIERFACAIKPAPMPVVMHQIVYERTSRSRTLPKFVIQPIRYRRGLAL